MSKREAALQVSSAEFRDVAVSRCKVQRPNERFGEGASDIIRTHEEYLGNPSFTFHGLNAPSDSESDVSEDEDSAGPPAGAREARPGTKAAGRKPPKLQNWRMNLTALSQVYNLYFAAYGNKIWVYCPVGAMAQGLGREPALVLGHAPSSAGSRLPSHIDRLHPDHANNIIVGFLGDAEIVLVCYDNGDVVAYHTREIAGYVSHRARHPESTARPRPRPFFEDNAGLSAWGLAIHSKSRLIAVSSNRAEVTVFAFALTCPPPPWKSLSPPHSPFEAAVLARKRNWRIVLSLKPSGDNIPSIDFISNPSGYAQKVSAVDIKGHIWILDIWRQDTTPSLLLPQDSFWGTRYRKGFWAVAALPASSFLELGPRRHNPSRAYFSIEASHMRAIALGIDNVPLQLPYRQSRYWIQTTRSLNLIEDTHLAKAATSTHGSTPPPSQPSEPIGPHGTSNPSHTNLPFPGEDDDSVAETSGTEDNGDSGSGVGNDGTAESYQGEVSEGQDDDEYQDDEDQDDDDDEDEDYQDDDENEGDNGNGNILVSPSQPIALDVYDGGGNEGGNGNGNIIISPWQPIDLDVYDDDENEGDNGNANITISPWQPTTLDVDDDGDYQVEMYDVPHLSALPSAAPTQQLEQHLPNDSEQTHGKHEIGSGFMATVLNKPFPLLVSRPPQQDSRSDEPSPFMEMIYIPHKGMTYHAPVGEDAWVNWLRREREWNQATHDQSEFEIAALGEHTSLFVTDEADLRLLTTSRRFVDIYCKAPLYVNLSGPYYSPYQRIQMVLHVPELSLVAAATLCGRVALISLTKSAWAQPTVSGDRSMRVDKLLPRVSEEEGQNARPDAPLFGIAMGPVQEIEDGMLRLRDGSGPKAFSRMYRLVLHYRDHTILSYLVSRPSPDDLLVI